MDDDAASYAHESVNASIQQVSLKLETAIELVRELRHEHSFGLIRRALLIQPADSNNVFNLMVRLNDELNEYMFPKQKGREQKAS